ncbi:MAG: YncE family protein [Dysgonamonadaceae bacterium]|jgi:YVTN family beta-propeller protein|nr:YncE family protein [Dysgonamonadaceae bacterium]
MKSRMKFVEIMSLWLLLVGISGCEKTPLPDPNPEPFTLHGVFILNQGGNKQNNASLSFYDPASQTVSTVPFPSESEPGQNEALGDLGQDLLIYGSKLYIVVSNSSYIRVLDVKTKQSLGKIVLEDNEKKPRNPRYLAAYGGKVYVTCSTDGTVARIDTASLQTDGSVNVGANPEGIAASIYNAKLYVANSGFGTGNTVSVIDIATFREEATIETGLNPNIIRAGDQTFAYLSYQGNFGDIAGGFQRIDLRNHAVTTLGAYPKADFAWEDGVIFYYDITYNPVDWSTQVTYGKFNDTGESYAHPSPLITDGTQLTAPYAIAVEPYTETVYLADAGDYSNPGTIYVFDPAGKQTDAFTVGIIPCKIVFY